MRISIWNAFIRESDVINGRPQNIIFTWSDFPVNSFVVSSGVRYRFVSDFRKEDSRLFRKIRYWLPEETAGRPELLVADAQIRLVRLESPVDPQTVGLEQILPELLNSTLPEWLTIGNIPCLPKVMTVQKSYFLVNFDNIWRKLWSGGFFIYKSMACAPNKQDL